MTETKEKTKETSIPELARRVKIAKAVVEEAIVTNPNRTQEDNRSRLIEDMISEDKKSIDIARTIITEIMTQDDDYTDLSEKQIIHLGILETIAEILNDPFLRLFCKRFKVLRKSKNRKDRQEAVKMVQSLREEQDGIQSKLKDLLGVGGV